MNAVDKSLSYCWLFEIGKERAQINFCAFGEDSWKQVVDGKYHKYGKMVFDEGLHGGEKEPGYYTSACKALEFAKEHLCEPLTIEFYKKLHQIACSHFKKDENNTNMMAVDAGRFRKKENHTLFKFLIGDIIDFYNRSNPLQAEVIEGFNTVIDVFPFENNIQVNMRMIDNLKHMDSVKSKLESIDFIIYNKMEKIIRNNIELLQKQLNNWNKDTSLSGFAPSIKTYGIWIKISYCDREDFETIGQIFYVYNQKMSELNKKNDGNKYYEKLGLIADLFQKLEFIHPFPDGQGRTDLILLSKLLSEQGFTPPILLEPYVSSYVPLNEWTQYLQEGIKTGQI